ncbi:Methyltransferase type 11 [Candidatus Zixiibacteriota bacterium]|nr:Methyltransferase type 11 [candidate division Zixibacteria bacterium]
MQAYGQGFAKVYNLKWAGFAKQVAPAILNYYESTPIGKANKKALDLCCGAGHLAVYLLEKGYRVVGIDLSEHMLHYARENTRQYLESGRAEFVKGDAADFKLKERFGLVYSTYDSLNHLENEEALKKCFKCVYDVCDGYFIFDLNTQKGLKNWNMIHVNDSADDLVIITRSFYDGQGPKAWTKISGFIRQEGGLYERFEENVFNTVFKLERVKEALFEVGWKNVYFASMRDLSARILEPEEELRVFVVAGKI